MGQFLIDNNVIANYFSGRLSEKGMQFIGQLIDEVPKVSVITQIEALSWVGPDKSKEAIIREFISDCRIYEITPEVVRRCVSIRRGRSIKTPDAIIAATAITNQLQLVTSAKDFSNIEKLEVIDPMLM